MPSEGDGDMRKWLVVVAALVLGVAVPVVAVAATTAPAARTATGSFRSALNEQKAFWRAGRITTTSKTFHVVPGLHGTICAEGEVSGTLSVQGTGAPMGLLILQDFGPTMKPGPIRFTLSGAADSTSFTFVTNTSTFEANDDHQFDVEWRSPTGAKTTLIGATLNLQYQAGTHTCPTKP
jgi:hypothetical protein